MAVSITPTSSHRRSVVDGLRFQDGKGPTHSTISRATLGAGFMAVNRVPDTAEQLEHKSQSFNYIALDTWAAIQEYQIASVNKAGRGSTRAH